MAPLVEAVVASDHGKGLVVHARDQHGRRPRHGGGCALIPRALKLTLLAILSAGCGLVAGLGDPPTYLEPKDGSSGTSGTSGTAGTSIVGAAGSTDQPDGSTNGAGGTVGAAGIDNTGTGRGGDLAMTTCVINCPDANPATVAEASAVNICRGLSCPTDAGMVAYDVAVAEPCLAPSTCLVIPDTWQPVAVTMGTSDAAVCPPGFGDPKPFYTSAAGDPYTCSCGCAGTQGCSGNVTLNTFSGDAGAGCTGAPSTRSLAVSQGCATGNYGDILYGNSYTISVDAFGPGPACSAAPKATQKPLVVAPAVTVCTPDTICPGGACLTASESTSLCVEKAGTNLCPGNYPNRSIMSGAVDDGRDCGVCSCGSTLTCALTGVLLDNNYWCSTDPPYVMTADINACTPAPANFPCNAVQAVAIPGGDPTCVTTSPSMPIGKVALNDAKTITVCCR